MFGFCVHLSFALLGLWCWDVLEHPIDKFLVGFAILLNAAAAAFFLIWKLLQ